MAKLALGNIPAEAYIDTDGEMRAVLDQKDDAVTTHGWSVRLLAKVCGRSHIWYKETPVYTTLLGVSVTCGGTSTISVKSSLSEPEKIAVIAHELGHIALGHTQVSRTEFLRDPRNAEIPVSNDRERELEASIWAAHLLVRLEVYQRYFAAWKDAGCSEDDAAAHAEEDCANALNIPRGVVQLWAQHRHHEFDVEPRTWLQF